jgi:hypothetical protein
LRLSLNALRLDFIDQAHNDTFPLLDLFIGAASQREIFKVVIASPPNLQRIGTCIYRVSIWMSALDELTLTNVGFCLGDVV